jgi:hypothetical protein
LGEFPGLSGWLETINKNDAGIMLVAMMAFAGVVWLYNARFVFPRLLPFARELLLMVFWATFGVMTIYKVADPISITNRLFFAFGVLFLLREVFIGIRAIQQWARQPIIDEGEADEAY